MFVCCECRVLSGRGPCDELITRPEESYRLWCVVMCDLETSRMRRPWPALGRSATGKKNYFYNIICISSMSTWLYIIWIYLCWCCLCAGFVSIETCMSDYNTSIVKIKNMYCALLVEIKTIHKMHGTYIYILFYWIWNFTSSLLCCWRMVMVPFRPVSFVTKHTSKSLS